MKCKPQKPKGTEYPFINKGYLHLYEKKNNVSTNACINSVGKGLRSLSVLFAIITLMGGMYGTIKISVLQNTVCDQWRNDSVSVSS